MSFLFKKKPCQAKVTDCTGRLRDGVDTRPKRRQIVYIHAADVALPGFTFDGIKVYFDRSLVCDGGVMVVAAGVFEGAAKGYIDYLVSLGIGPDMVIEVDVPKGQNLYHAILASDEAKKKIYELVYNYGFKIEFFNTRNGLEEKFIRDIGMTWRHVASWPSHVADQGNNKAWVRRLARSLGVEHFFPWHIIVRVPIGLRILVGLFTLIFMSAMSSEKDKFVIKLTNWASGLGQLYTRSKRAFLKFFIRNWRQAKEVIFEEDLGPHVSITYVRRYKDGKIQDHWSTVQLIARTPEGVEDLGRVLSTGLPHGLDYRDRDFMHKASAFICNALRTQAKDGTGVICLDCARRKGGPPPKERSTIRRVQGAIYRLFLGFVVWVLKRRGYSLFGSNPVERVVLEANIRVTFSDYVRQLMKQAKKALRARHMTCIQFKVCPARAKSFEALRAELGDLMFSLEPASESKWGVIPVVPRCLTSGYVYLVAFGESYESAREVAVEAATRLGDIKFATHLQSAE